MFEICPRRLHDFDFETGRSSRGSKDAHTDRSSRRATAVVRPFTYGSSSSSISSAQLCSNCIADALTVVPNMFGTTWAWSVSSVSSVSTVMSFASSLSSVSMAESSEESVSSVASSSTTESSVSASASMASSRSFFSAATSFSSCIKSRSIGVVVPGSDSPEST